MEVAYFKDFGDRKLLFPELMKGSACKFLFISYLQCQDMPLPALENHYNKQ